MARAIRYPLDNCPGVFGPGVFGLPNGRRARVGSVVLFFNWSNSCKTEKPNIQGVWVLWRQKTKDKKRFLIDWPVREGKGKVTNGHHFPPQFHQVHSAKNKSTGNEPMSQPATLQSNKNSHKVEKSDFFSGASVLSHFEFSADPPSAPPQRGGGLWGIQAKSQSINLKNLSGIPLSK